MPRRRRPILRPPLGPCLEPDGAGDWTHIAQKCGPGCLETRTRMHRTSAQNAQKFGPKCTEIRPECRIISNAKGPELRRRCIDFGPPAGLNPIPPSLRDERPTRHQAPCREGSARRRAAGHHCARQFPALDAFWPGDLFWEEFGNN